MQVNVTKSYLPPIEQYQRYIERIFKSGWLTNNGQCVQELTRHLEDYLQVKNLILVANATLGLQVVYKALELTGEVITTPFSFVATTSSLVWAGLKPCFVDIDPNTFCINESLIEAAINEKTSAILPVHVYGNVCHMEKVAQLAHKYNLKVVYDAAPAFGVNYQGKSVLKEGDVSILSFHATKLFHTGEGGALIIRDDQLYTKIKEMINFGFSVDGSSRLVGLGINAKMSELHAALGLCVLEDVEKIISKTEKIDALYRRHLSKVVQMLAPHPEISKNYAYFPVVFKTEEHLLKAVHDLNQLNIYPRRYFYPALNTLPYIKYTPMPIAESIAQRVLCLPIFSQLDEKDAIRICEVVSNAAN